MNIERTWRIEGQVQGVGFRPFVLRLAREIGLAGTVRNDPAGVVVRAAGAPADLSRFARRLEEETPSLARIDALSLLAEGPGAGGGRTFTIEESDSSPSRRGRVTVDAAVCSDCLRELFDPGDRRHRHPLINCTACGPRYTIVRDLPYDRARTTMASFPLCDECAIEFRDPADRRFHAQPVCCPECGPKLRLLDGEGREVPGEPFRGAARILAAGRILAMKGLGGYHLVADAGNEAAVRRLREAKGRDHKPFAVMVGDLAAAGRLARLSRAASDLHRSPIRPVVLSPRSDEAGALAGSVAPGCHRVGLMLPNTPMQHLLMAEAPGPLVMTSANRTDDPLIAEDAEAMRDLRTVSDGFLVHDRPIERAVDDSVLIDAGERILPLRRARGYVPEPLPLPRPAARPGLAVGGVKKAAVAVVRGGEAVLSQHLGDLEHALAYRRFLMTIEDLLRLYEVEPRWIAADRHPRYPSHRYAREAAAARGLDLVLVQHHHAHLASLLAEHGRTDPVVGIVCDGVGYGEDGTAWGGEILVGDLGACRRVGRLRPLNLPGGDAAAVETGRCALAWLFDCRGEAAFGHPAARRVLPDEERRRAVAEMLAAGFRCPPSSGLGRLFDAAASLLGLTDRNHYEAMSGILMEGVACRAESAPSGEGIVPLVEREGIFELDHRPLLERLLSFATGSDAAGPAARLFHDALADGLARGAVRAAEETGVGTVGLTGGVFGNTLLTDLTAGRLRAAGLEVLLHREVPPGDGGIAYGQAAVAAAKGSARE